jgi:chromate transporter
MMAGALRGMGAVAAGLVAGMGCKLAASLARHPWGPCPAR